MFCIVFYNNTQAQCNVFVPNSTLQHIACPNGGAVGFASMSQNSYSNFSWFNTTNGQLYNGGGGNGGTSRSDLDAGTYQITASGGSCPLTSTSNFFTILEAEVNFNFNPTQACPSLCNVIVSASLGVTIPNVSYSYQFDSNPIVSLPNSLSNQCGGAHTFEIFADGLACGIENIGVSQFAQMNLATAETNSTCALLGSSTVSITGVGASGLNTYCTSEPQYATNTTIDNVSVIGDNTSISNNTSGFCDQYTDYTAKSADVTPGGTYDLIIDLGSCNSSGQYLEDIANVYIDWNIDGTFDAVTELVGQVTPTQSPSTHTLSISVPATAIPGQSRMRIVAQNSQYQPSNQAAPCDIQSYFGSVEDYTIQVNGSVATPISYLWSNGQNTATATNLIAGTYTVTITDANSCTATTTSVITGNGSGNVTSVIAGTNQTICNGGTPANLTATGNSSGGLYSWSPSSAFTNPNQQNSSFNNSGLNTTSVFTVTFTDASGCTANDNVTITVNPVPSVTISALPNPACVGDNIVITAATSIPVNKYRFQSNLGSGWNNLNTPSWVINNPVTFNNTTQSTQFRVKVREDNGCAVSSWSPTISIPVINFNPLPILHN